MQIITPCISRAVLNTEPAICNGHLSLPIKTALKGREGGELNAEGGVEQNASERRECEGCFIFTFGS